jgi:hypothetical protein
MFHATAQRNRHARNASYNCVDPNIENDMMQLQFSRDQESKVLRVLNMIIAMAAPAE